MYCWKQLACYSWCSENNQAIITHLLSYQPLIAESSTFYLRDLINPTATLQQTHTTFPLPWVRQKTTSRHSACVLVGWPPLGPYTLLSHRMNTLSCHGQWLLYSDQNLNKLIQKRLIRSIKKRILHFCSLKLFRQNTPSSWWSSLLSACREATGVCVLKPCLHGVGIC